jgi:hypothetical protein
MSHWYDKEGNPRYEVEGKNGMRASNLRDARKHGWVPSATSIWGDVIARPQLNNWIQTELMQALWTETHSAERLSGGGGFPEFEKLARARYGTQQQETMGRGTSIHNDLEKYFSGKDTPKEHMFLCDNVARVLEVMCGDNKWIAEKSFAHPSGYGGKVDLHSDEWVVDFKTKEFPPEPDVKKMVYDDQGCQLAAYDQGLGGGRRLLNLFIDHRTGAVLEWEHEDVDRFRNMFNHALALWKLVKKYDPSFTDRRIM